MGAELACFFFFVPGAQFHIDDYFIALCVIRILIANQYDKIAHGRFVFAPAFVDISIAMKKKSTPPK